MPCAYDKERAPHTRVVVVVVLAIQLAHDADVRSTTDRTSVAAIRAERCWRRCAGRTIS
jgi:hypothetical protein